MADNDNDNDETTGDDKTTTPATGDEVTGTTGDGTGNEASGTDDADSDDESAAFDPGAPEGAEDDPDGDEAAAAGDEGGDNDPLLAEPAEPDAGDEPGPAEAATTTRRVPGWALPVAAVGLGLIVGSIFLLVAGGDEDTGTPPVVGVADPNAGADQTAPQPPAQATKVTLNCKVTDPMTGVVGDRYHRWCEGASALSLHLRWDGDDIVADIEVTLTDGRKATVSEKVAPSPGATGEGPLAPMTFEVASR